MPGTVASWPCRSRTPNCACSSSCFVRLARGKSRGSERQPAATHRLRLHRLASTGPCARRTVASVSTLTQAEPRCIGVVAIRRADAQEREVLAQAPRRQGRFRACVSCYLFTLTRGPRAATGNARHKLIAEMKSPPGSRQRDEWWRRRDSAFHLFRDGLDYAFILSRWALRSGASYPKSTAFRILVSARSSPNQPIYESLQGRVSWPVSTPRRRHTVPCETAAGFTE